MNRTSLNALSHWMRHSKNMVVASPFVEVVWLHISSSLGWTSCWWQWLPRSLTSPP